MKKLLLFLSKTDQSIYDKCPQSAKNMQLAFGLFVLLTGLLAFCSGTFALSNLFMEYNESSNKSYLAPNAWFYAAGLGVFYAFIIMAIDREVVAAKNKMAVVPRLFLAIIIGVVVAVPLELKLLEGRIDKQIKIDSIEANIPFEEKRDAQTAILNPRRDSLYSKIQFYENEVVKWRKHMIIELVGETGKSTYKLTDGRIFTGRSGKGNAYREAEKNMKTDSVNQIKAQKRYDNFMKTEYGRNQQKASLEFKRTKDIPEFDLLSKFQTLNQIIKEDKNDTNSAGMMSWGIRLLFILFEIIPSLIKLMTPSSEYDALLEARRRMNIQLTNARTNEALMDMENDIDLIVEDKNHVPLPYMDEIEDRIMT